MQELTGERHAAATALFRALAAGEGKTPKRRNDSKARSSRTNPPSSLPSTWREDVPRSTSKAIRATIMVDIDGIPEEIFDETLERVRPTRTRSLPTRPCPDAAYVSSHGWKAK